MHEKVKAKIFWFCVSGLHHYQLEKSSAFRDPFRQRSMEEETVLNQFYFWFLKI